MKCVIVYFHLVYANPETDFPTPSPRKSFLFGTKNGVAAFAAASLAPLLARVIMMFPKDTRKKRKREGEGKRERGNGR